MPQMAPMYWLFLFFYFLLILLIYIMLTYYFSFPISSVNETKSSDSLSSLNWSW